MAACHSRDVLAVPHEPDRRFAGAFGDCNRQCERHAVTAEPDRRLLRLDLPDHAVDVDVDHEFAERHHLLHRLGGVRLDSTESQGDPLGDVLEQALDDGAHERGRHRDRDLALRDPGDPLILRDQIRGPPPQRILFGLQTAQLGGPGPLLIGRRLARAGGRDPGEPEQRREREAPHPHVVLPLRGFLRNATPTPSSAPCTLPTSALSVTHSLPPTAITRSTERFRGTTSESSWKPSLRTAGTRIVRPSTTGTCRWGIASWILGRLCSASSAFPPRPRTPSRIPAWSSSTRSIAMSTSSMSVRGSIVTLPS